jgi:hypothetical protein
VNPATLMAKTASQTLLEKIQQRSAGLTPLYYLDFMNDIAYANGTDLGGIANIPSLTGTTALSSAGHTVSSASNALMFPLTGVTYPLTLVVEFIRGTDSGGDEYLAIVTNGTVNEWAGFDITPGDQNRAYAFAGGAQQASVTASGTSIIGARVRSAMRVNTNSVQACRTQNGGATTLGTEDTLVTLPANPTKALLGIQANEVTSTYRGTIREFIILSGAQDNTTLQTLVKI